MFPGWEHHIPSTGTFLPLNGHFVSLNLASDNVLVQMINRGKVEEK
jgi:hypothetical protein